MAITAICAKQETEKNDPLTLEDLRGMVNNPIYVVFTYGKSAWWEIIAKADEDIISFRSGGWEMFADYGRTWIAYRRPPGKEAVQL